MYKLISWLNVNNGFKSYEGALIEDIKTNKRYITSGVYKWEATPERMAKCEEVERIDFELFFNRFNQYITRSKLYM